MARTWMAAIAACLLMTAGGCKTPEQFQAEYPTWPAWGWWNKPAPKAVDEKNLPPVVTGSATPAGTEPTSPTGPAASTGTASTMPAAPKGLLELAEHREAVWQSVSKLQNIENYTPEEQKSMLQAAQTSLPQWYGPMDVTAPDPTKDSDWVDVLIWDFMPDKQFWAALDAWGAIARKDGAEFPGDMSRRQFRQWIRDYNAKQMKELRP